MLINFDEKKHRYSHSRTNETYISVTQLLERYFNKFDGKYWSEYKAIQRIIETKIGEEGFKAWKQSIGGYEKVIATFYEQANQDNVDLVPEYIADILEEWRVKNSIACEEGNEFHNRQETKWKSKWVHMFKNKFRKYRSQSSAKYEIKQIEDGIYTELRLWSEHYQLAGHADLPIVEKPFIDIYDYKTNKKLEFDNYKHPTKGHQMLKGSLKHLKDCNGIHYNLQLSLYAKLMEMAYGLEPRHIQIDYALRDFKGGFTGKMKHIPLAYMEKEVNIILKDREYELYGK